MQGGDMVIKQGAASSFSLPNLPGYQSGTEEAGTRLCICENGRVFRALGNTCLINANTLINPCTPTT